MHVLDSPQVLKFFAWYETTNHLWLILEYCVGGSLQTLLKQDVSLPESSIHDFGRDLVTSLAYLHSKGFIYCDLKPSNLLLDENGRIKLGGFGLSRKLSELARQAQSGQALPTAKHGTPVYMAPELFMEGATHSTRSDIWSLGVVFYEMASGRPPFVAPTLTQLVSDVLNVEPAPLGSHTREFQDLVSRMLDKNPATRITWPEVAAHPFWGCPIQVPASMPPEPALDAFLRRHRLLAPEEPDRAEALRKSRAVAANARSSVDVFRISQMAARNVEKEQVEGDANGEYGTTRAGGKGASAPAQARTQAGDVALDNTDAELDFEERADAGDDEDADGSSRPGSTAGGDREAGALAAAPPSSSSGSGEADAASELASRVRDGLSVSGGSTVAQGSTVAGDGRGGGAPDRKDSGGASMTRMASLTAGASGEGGSRLQSPAPGDARPSVTPQLGVNPRQDKRAAGAGADSEAQGLGVRGAAESLGATAGHGVALEDVVWHASDMIVKPIVGNRRIERVPEPKWDAGSLPFKPLSLHDLLMAPQATLESFLQQVYVALSSSSAVTDKINLLAYFETLCGDPGAANVLVNSTLMALFVRLLRTQRHDRLRVRLCSVIGKLIRHATYIADELASTNVMEVLADALKDSGEKTKRRAMGALGELLFFAATQQHEGGAGAGAGGGDAENEVEGAGDGGAREDREGGYVWEVPGTVFSQIARILRQGEDEIVQHYALKAVENIATQGGAWGQRFATQEVAFHAAQIMANTKQDALRGTAASTVCRLCRANPALVPYVVDKCGVRLFVTGLSDASSKSQGASATMLCLAAASDALQARVRAQLLEDRQLVGGLLHLFNSALPVLQAKAVLTLGFLCRQSLGFLARVGPKAFDRLERLSRERDPYLRASLVAFREEAGAQLGGFLGLVSEELSSLSRRKFAAGGAPRAASRIQHAGILPMLLLSPATRGAALTADLVERVASFLATITAPGVAFAGLPEFRESLVQTLAALQEHAEALTGAVDGAAKKRGGDAPSPGAEAPEPPEQARRDRGDALARATAADLLPTLVRTVGAADADSEVRFASVSLLTDLVLSYLGRVSRAGGEGASAEVDGAIRAHLLPLLPSLLDERGAPGVSEVMPLSSLKMCVALMEAGPQWTAEVAALGAAPKFFDNLSIHSQNNNVHNIRVCRALVVSGALTLEEAARLDVVPRVDSVLAFAHENAVDPFLEPALDLCCSLLERDQHALHEGVPGAGLTRGLVGAVPVLADLLGYPDAGVGALAAEALGFLCDMWPQACAPALLSRDLAGVLVGILQPAGGEFPPVPAVQLGVLKALACLEPLEEGGVDADTVGALLDVLGGVARGGGDPGLAGEAEHAAMALQSMLEG